MIGTFTGEAYLSWITIKPSQPIVADAIIVYKYGNNIPQKIQAYGYPVTTTTPTTTIASKLIPGLIQAEAYDAMQGVQKETTSDTGGGQNLGYIDDNDWMDYKVNVASTGPHTIGLRVASTSNTGIIEVRNSAGAVLGTVNVPNTGGWQTYTTLRVPVSLSAGEETLRLFAKKGSWNINWFEATTTTSIASSKPLPGQIQAEAYDAMQGVQKETTGDTGGGQNVGYIDDNDWMEYRVNVASAGAYTVALRAASPNTSGIIEVRNAAGAVLGSVNVPHTGGWQAYTTLRVPVSLSAGEQTLRLYAKKGGWNLNWFEASASATSALTQAVITFPALPGKTVGDAAFDLIASSTNTTAPIAFASSNPGVVSVSNATGRWKATVVGAGSATITASQLASPGFAAAADVTQTITVASAPLIISTSKPLPGQIQAEAYDAMQGVQKETTGDTGGGQNVGYIDDNDWMEYRVNVASAGAYTVALRAASPNTSGIIEVRNAAGAVLGSVNVPHTGGWQAYTTLRVPVSLSAGEQTLRLYAKKGGWNLNWFEASASATSALTQAVITFPALPGKTVGDAAFDLIASSTNTTAPIAFASSNPGVVSVSNATGRWKATVVGAGSATITASQLASPGFAAAADVTQTITVSSPFVAPPTVPGSITIQVTFASTPSTATASFADMKYNKSLGFLFVKDDAHPGDYNLVYKVLNGGVAVDGKTYPRITYTDGAGNPVGYKASFAINGRGDEPGSAYTQYPQYAEMIKSGFDVMNHTRNHGGYNRYQEIKELEKEIFQHTGYRTRTGVIPTADEGFVSSWIQEGYKFIGSTFGVAASRDGYDAYVNWNDRAIIRSMNTDYLLVSRFTMDGMWNAELGSADTWVDNMFTAAANGNKIMAHAFSHGPGGAAEVQYFQQFVNYIKNHPSNNDRVWMAGTQEFAEYYETKSNVVKSETLSGNTLTITLDLSKISNRNKLRDMSLLVNSDAAINGITVTGADSYSYNLGTKLINVFEANENVASPFNDPTPPQITSVKASGNTLTITYDKTVTQSGIAGYEVVGNTVTGMAGSGTTWTLTLQNNWATGQKLTYRMHQGNAAGNGMKVTSYIEHPVEASTSVVTPVELPQSVITFNALPDRKVGDLPFELVATSTNTATPITFTSSNAAIVSVSNATGKWLAKVVGAGTANITASQAASTSFKEAVSVVRAQVVTSSVAPLPAPAPAGSIDEDPALKNGNEANRVTGVVPLDKYDVYNLNNTMYLDALVDGTTNHAEYGYGMLLDVAETYFDVRDYHVKLSQLRIANHSYGDYGVDAEWYYVPKGKFPKDRVLLGKHRGRPFNGYSNFPEVPLAEGIEISWIIRKGPTYLPKEVSIVGSYIPKPAKVYEAREKKPFENQLGINSFVWDFTNGDAQNYVVPAKLEVAKTFKGGFRFYMDATTFEANREVYTFNPTSAGWWNYDLLFSTLKENNLPALACVRGQSIPMLRSYPSGERDMEKVPVYYGSNYEDPASYKDNAQLGFQTAARYGTGLNADGSDRSAYLLSKVKVQTTKFTNSEGENFSCINDVKVGLGTLTYVQHDNERDKWWKGRQGYQTGREYAANMSAFYDGHKGALGPGVGVKDADPNMKVVTTGIALANTYYYQGMLDWCREHRGYKKDRNGNILLDKNGAAIIDFPADVIAFHNYLNNGGQQHSGSRGVAPEIGKIEEISGRFVKFVKEKLPGVELWQTEAGYDTRSTSSQAALAIGSKSQDITQADWNLRISLINWKLGIDRTMYYMLYDTPLNTEWDLYTRSGFVNNDQTPRAAADFFKQTGDLIGKFTYNRTLNTDPYIIEGVNGAEKVYACWIPDEVGRTATYQLDLGGAAYAYIYTPKAGSATMTMQKVPTAGGKVTINVTETPIFVKTMETATTISSTGTRMLNTDLGSFKLYPNPTSESINIELQSEDTDNKVEVKITHLTSGKLYNTFNFEKTSLSFQQKLNLKSLPVGGYVIEVIQGDKKEVKKFFKVK
ncbi:carbohydrate-binding protein [Rufibacter tibetensis]|uniref:carbohydrate-binding protein n=1 Tax=Rufibacter tibetensis TaxID=512763 RepID=UPI00146FD44F|nr:carbohydrate-binding protein [Rufibacter tibetensis]